MGQIAQRREKCLYVQYGAGMCGPPGWVNFDVSPTLRLQRMPLFGSLFQRVSPQFPRTVRFGDIVGGLPLTAGSCDAVYCSHTLEHLSLADFRTAIRNTFSYLRPGGRFRFVLPDLDQLARDYLANSAPDAAITFMHESHLGQVSRPRRLIDLLRSSFGNSSQLWMWDYKAIKVELDSVGFLNTRRANIGDSGDTMFAAVEDDGRWHKCLGVECWRSSEQATD